MDVSVTAARLTAIGLVTLLMAATPPPLSIDQLRDAAEAGQHPAEYRLGVAYRDGLGVVQDPAKAAEWFQRAADGCYAPAQDALGVAFETAAGVPRNVRVAARWYRLAAAQRDPRGTYHLAIALYENRAYEADSLDDARYAGTCRTLSIPVGGTPGDELHSTDPRVREENGFRFMQFAAQSGDRDAQYRVGDAFEHGRGVKPSSADAVEWYRKAAAQGQPDAKASLARLRVG